MAANGRDFARVYQLKLDGADVAQAFGLVLGGRFYYLLIGADYERFGKHSPGLVLYDLLIEEWIKEGGTVFDFTIGDEAFKRDFGTAPTAMHALVETATLKGRLALSAFDAMRGLRKWKAEAKPAAVLRSMGETLRGVFVKTAVGGDPGPSDRSGVRRSRLIRRCPRSYLPSSTDLARAASTASASRFFSRSSPISTPSAAAVVPFGLVTCLRSTAGSSRLSAAERGGAIDRLHGKQLRRLGGQADLLRRRRQAFDEMENIGRAGAGHGRHRVHQAFVADGRDLAACRQEVADESLGLLGRRSGWRRRPSCPCRWPPACSACSA